MPPVEASENWMKCNPSHLWRRGGKAGAGGDGHGGMLIGSRNAPKIIEKLKGPLFMEIFAAKGRPKSLMESMPVRVILNDLIALRGRPATLRC